MHPLLSAPHPPLTVLPPQFCFTESVIQGTENNKSCSTATLKEPWDSPWPETPWLSDWAAGNRYFFDVFGEHLAEELCLPVANN